MYPQAMLQFFKRKKRLKKKTEIQIDGTLYIVFWVFGRVGTIDRSLYRDGET